MDHHPDAVAVVDATPDSRGTQSTGKRPPTREARFPTATVDLRPPLATLDNALAWLARVRLLRGASTPLARWSRRVVVHMHRIDCQRFDAPHTDAFEMLQLWISNGATEDAEGLRCQTRWTSDTPLLNVKTDHGLWLRVSPFEGTQRLAGVGEEADLPARCSMGRGGMQYLGLAVKYPDDESAYIVTRESHRQFVDDGGTWRYPPAALSPGLHAVDVAFRSRGGGAALIRLSVLNLGRGGPLRAEVATGQLLT